MPIRVSSMSADFRAERVGLAVELLAEEIELAPIRIVRTASASSVRAADVGGSRSSPPHVGLPTSSATSWENAPPTAPHASPQRSASWLSKRVPQGADLGGARSAARPNRAVALIV